MLLVFTVRSFVREGSLLRVGGCGHIRQTTEPVHRQHPRPGAHYVSAVIVVTLFVYCQIMFHIVCLILTAAVYIRKVVVSCS